MPTNSPNDSLQLLQQVNGQSLLAYVMIGITTLVLGYVTLIDGTTEEQAPVQSTPTGELIPQNIMPTTALSDGPMIGGRKKHKKTRRNKV